MKRSKTSPQSRSHQWLKERGWLFQKTEQTIHIPDKERPGQMRMFKKDLFGFADIVGIHPDQLGTTYFQVTGGMNNKGDRMAKIEAIAATPLILKTGNTVELHVWRKMGPRGGVKRWTVYRAQARLHGDKLQWIEVFEKEDDEFEKQPGLIFERQSA